MTAFTPPQPPAISSQRTRKYRAFKSQFGGGYISSAPDGINNIIDSWQLNFENLNQTDRNTLVAFFDSVGSWATWTWQAPGDSVSKTWLVVDQWQETASAGNVFTIQINIQQLF